MDCSPILRPEKVIKKFDNIFIGRNRVARCSCKQNNDAFFQDFYFIFYFSLHHCICSDLLYFIFYLGTILSVCIYIYIQYIYIYIYLRVNSDFKKCLQGLLVTPPPSHHSPVMCDCVFYTTQWILCFNLGSCSLCRSDVFFLLF